jgi:hypothetical protein
MNLSCSLQRTREAHHLWIWCLSPRLQGAVQTSSRGPATQSVLNSAICLPHPRACTSEFHFILPLRCKDPLCILVSEQHRQNRSREPRDIQSACAHMYVDIQCSMHACAWNSHTVAHSSLASQHKYSKNGGLKAVRSLTQNEYVRTFDTKGSPQLSHHLSLHIQISKYAV